MIKYLIKTITNSIIAGIIFIIFSLNIFIINADAQWHRGDEGEEGPTVKKLENGTYDYAKFKEKLVEIKKKVLGKGFKDENRAVITASADIEYQQIITIMDNLQTYTSDKGEVLPLFPE